MQGTSLVPLLEDPDREWSGAALLENYYNMFHFGWSQLRGLRTDRFKFVEAPRPELYDLQEDPDELVNLASAEQEMLPSSGGAAICIGATFPFAVRVMARQARDAAPMSARIYGWGTLGSIAGAIMAGLFLLPALWIS